MVDPQEQPVTPAGDGESWWRGTLALMTVIAVLFLGLGAFPLVRYLFALAPMDSYRHAVPCAAAGPSSQNCYTTMQVALEDASFRPGSHGKGSLSILLVGQTQADRWRVRLALPAGLTEVLVPGGASLEQTLHAPADAIATTYRGRVIKLEVRGASLPTGDFPGVFAYADRLFAIVFVGIGGTVLLILLCLRTWLARVHEYPADVESRLAFGRKALTLAFRILVGLSIVVIAVGLFLLARLRGFI